MALNRPDWLTLPAPVEADLDEMKRLLDAGRLHTVCESADCPNVGECFGRRTCTFMILGNNCTRRCRFCAVAHGQPDPVDPEEPMMVALTAGQLGLRHVVVTSVTRDDLPDGGAGQFAATVRSIREALPGTTVEVLIPDLQGRKESLLTIIQSGPDIVNHNLETVPRLYSRVRPGAVYTRSLKLIKRVGELAGGMLTKSGLMLGLGEEPEEVIQVMEDLRSAGCRVLTLGQYLSPSPRHLPVARYVSPGEFEQFRRIGLEQGFLEVNAGPLVRSSYQAAMVFDKIRRIEQ